MTTPPAPDRVAAKEVKMTPTKLQHSPPRAVVSNPGDVPEIGDAYVIGSQPGKVVSVGELREDGSREFLVQLDPPPTRYVLAPDLVAYIEARIAAKMANLLSFFVDSDEEFSLALAAIQPAATRAEVLVYADWLEEKGRLRQAERIRESMP